MLSPALFVQERLVCNIMGLYRIRENQGVLAVKNPVWAEINLGAIAHNTAELHRLCRPETGLMAVVKANAYGHGMLQVARAALDAGASWLGVARVEEGLSLRRAGFDCPVLVLGYTPDEALREVLDYGLTQTVYSLDGAEELSRQAGLAGKQVAVHIKVDTGMGRLGLRPGAGLVEDILRCARLPNLDPQGILTHFAMADAADDSYTRSQLAAFRELLDQLARHGLEFPVRHCANSAALIQYPETHLDLVRAGISLYGLKPSPEVNLAGVSLIPAMTLKARVAHVKPVGQGAKISYGCTYAAPGPTVIATVPAGYADGYSRLLSSRGRVLVHGQRAPVVGRVCMDQCMADVGHIPGVAPGDEVVLLGRQGDEEIAADEIAGLMGTINYEVLCLVSYRVPRLYV